MNPLGEIKKGEGGGGGGRAPLVKIYGCTVGRDFNQQRGPEKAIRRLAGHEIGWFALYNLSKASNLFSPLVVD